MRDAFIDLRPTGFLLRVLRRSRHVTRVLQHIVRRTAAQLLPRERLNRFYLTLNSAERSVFYNMFSKIFREGAAEVDEGVWGIEFLGERLKLPLRNEMMWLDWDNALSIIGHDIDVKITYETLLKSKMPPQVFFDVGANYGTHSLLMLAKGVSTVSFEPNPACRVQFESLCSLNDLTGDMHGLAVGDRRGLVEFWFPERHTWLGTMVETVRQSLQPQYDLRRIEVELITIDDFVRQSGVSPDLLKIDTEGNEIHVIKGSAETIKAKRPLIIFESNTAGGKRELWQTLADLDYVVCPLPLRSIDAPQSFSLAEFEASARPNFIALPKATPG